MTKVWKLKRKYHMGDLVLQEVNGRQSTIGRFDADLVCESLFTSRRHCTITYKNGIFYIEDLNSTNGTFLNKDKLIPNVGRELREGDVIGLGIGESTLSEYFIFEFGLFDDILLITLDDDDDDISICSVGTTGIQKGNVDPDPDPVEEVIPVPVTLSPVRILVAPPPPRIRDDIPEEVEVPNENVGTSTPVVVNEISQSQTALASDSINSTNANKQASISETQPRKEDNLVNDGEKPSTSKKLQRALETSRSRTIVTAKKRKVRPRQLVSSSSGDDSSDGLSPVTETTQSKLKKDDAKSRQVKELMRNPEECEPYVKLRPLVSVAQDGKLFINVRSRERSQISQNSIQKVLSVYKALIIKNNKDVKEASIDQDKRQDGAQAKVQSKSSYHREKNHPRKRSRSASVDIPSPHGKSAKTSRTIKRNSVKPQTLDNTGDSRPSPSGSISSLEARPITTKTVERNGSKISVTSNTSYKQTSATLRPTSLGDKTPKPLPKHLELEEVKKRLKDKPASSPKHLLPLDYSPAPRKKHRQGPNAPRPLEKNAIRESVASLPLPPTRASDSGELKNAVVPPHDKKLLLKQLCESDRLRKEEIPQAVKPVSNAPLKVYSTKKSRNDYLLDSLCKSKNPMVAHSASPPQAAPAKQFQPSAGAFYKLQSSTATTPGEAATSAQVSPKRNQTSNPETAIFTNSIPGTRPGITDNIPENLQGPEPTDYTSDEPIPEDQHYWDLLNWNPDWLKVPLPNLTELVTHNRKIVTNLPEFKDFESYRSTFYPLMLLELWESMRQDFNTSSKEPDNQFNRYQIGLQDEGHDEYCPMIYPIGSKKPSSNSSKSLYSWHWVKVMAFVASAGDHASPNDFGTITLDIRGPAGDVRAKTFFVLFTKECYEPVRKTTQIHSNLFLQAESKTVKHSMHCLVKLGVHQKIVAGNIGSVHRFTSIYPKVQNFKVLSQLQMTPLLNDILHPCCPEQSAILQANSSADLTGNLHTYVRNHLTPEQCGIVQHVTSRILKINRPEMLLVHGAPGTGKTLTIVGLALQALKSNLNSGGRTTRILVSAPTDLALNEVLLRFSGCTYTQDLKLVRIGEEVSEQLKKFSLRALVNEKEQCNRADEIKEKMNEINKCEETIDNIQAEMRLSSEHDYNTDIANLRQEKKKLEFRKASLEREDHEAMSDVLLNADVVFAKFSSCYDPLVQEYFGGRNANGHYAYGSEDSQRFTCCLVDEASNATEPDSLALLSLNCDKFVLIGDPKQQRPVPLSKAAEDRDFGQSLFLRLFNFYQSQPVNPVMMLNIQFRMNQHILRWPNQRFYQDKIVNHRSVKNRSNLQLQPYVFIDMRLPANEQQRLTNNVSTEVKVVREILLAIKRQSCIDKLHGDLSVGVVTPSQEHKHSLLKLVGALKLDNFKFWKSVEVNTADQFQGREKDIIILYCLQSVDKGPQMTPELLNVSLTRARMCLYIVGNAFGPANNDEMWKSLKDDALRRKVYKPLTEIDMSTADSLREWVEKSVIIRQTTA